MHSVVLCIHKFDASHRYQPLFGETPGRLLVEIAPEHVAAAEKAGLVIIGEATRDPYLYISHNGTTLIDSPIDQLKPLWKDGLVKYY